jgi:hypothetical protein
MDRFTMLYCDNMRCRVNTFERGDGTDWVTKVPGKCPGCGEVGLPLDGTQSTDQELGR